MIALDREVTMNSTVEAMRLLCRRLPGLIGLIFAPMALAAPPAGEQVYGNVCYACHDAGLWGAPMLGDRKDWTARLHRAGSVEGLVRVARKGRGKMPPRGGDSSLSDDELKAAIEFMLSESLSAP
jgi:cytochrome c5